MTKISKDYQRIDFERMVVRDEDTEEIVFMIRFSSLNEMGVEEIGEVQCLTTLLMNFFKVDEEIKGNACNKGGNDSMFALN